MAQREYPTIHINDYLTLDQNSLDARIESLAVQFSVKDAYEKTSLLRKANRDL